MAEKKYFWLKMPRNFFEKHYIKILRAKDNGDLLVMFYIWMITESIDHEGKLRFSEDIPYDAEMLAEAFPGYQAPISAKEMADYIFNFALTGNKYYNGKVLQVSSTTP